MQQEITNRFAAGDLRPSSDIEDLKYIGPYLSERLRAAFNPRGRRLTIRVFARRIAPLSIQELRSRLQRALNRRANQCSPALGLQSIIYPTSTNMVGNRVEL